MGLTAEPIDAAPADNPQRPSILVVGPKDVGKRSLVRRLVRGAKSGQASIPGGVVTSHRWSIDTKYYTADVNLWVSHSEDLLEDKAKAEALAAGCDALVLVFDLSEDASFASVQGWASSVDLAAFDVLLCIANKADLVPDHHAHETLQQDRPLQWEQRHRLVEAEDLSDASEQPPGFGRPAKSLDVRRQEFSEWCLDKGVEYIETCALDEHFDQRISVDGDTQGIARVRSALHAHMWPGMVMKPKLGTRPPRALSSGDESDFSVEYELLEEDGGRGMSPEGTGTAAETVRDEDGDGGAEASQTGGGVSGREAKTEGERQEDRSGNGGKEPREGEVRTEAKMVERGEATNTNTSTTGKPSESKGTNAKTVAVEKEAARQDSDGVPASETEPSPSDQPPAGTTHQTQPKGVTKGVDESGPLHLDEAAAMREVEHEGDTEFAEMERIMHQMASVRDRLSGLPDGARREEAARYAMRLMSMFGGEESDGETA